MRGKIWGEEAGPLDPERLLKSSSELSPFRPGGELLLRAAPQLVNAVYGLLSSRDPDCAIAGELPGPSCCFSYPALFTLFFTPFSVPCLGPPHPCLVCISQPPQTRPAGLQPQTPTRFSLPPPCKHNQGPTSSVEWPT